MYKRQPLYGEHTTAQDLHPLIKGDVRYEHLISNASDRYKERRRQIAWEAYGERLEIRNTRKD